MSEQEKHGMIFEKKHPSGADEWVCPTCGRRVLISWEPKFRRTILESGDPNVAHGGFWIRIPVVGNLQYPFVEGPPSYEYEETVNVEIEETRLALWETWIKNSNFKDLWNRDLR